MQTIYLDNAATTKPNEQVFKKVSAFALENYFNSSALYDKALVVADEIKKSRQNLEKYFNGYNVTFTSCGTESDNTAVFGFFKRGNGVTTMGEHSAIYQSFEQQKQKGLDVRFAKLNGDGSVNVENLLSLVDEKTTFLSLVHVNNETGAINDIEAIAKEVKKISPRITVHSDCVQSFCKVDLSKLNNVDLFSVSAHKIGGLKGVGALFFKNKLRVPPYIVGGGQEKGLRSGTENVLGILDFCECASELLPKIQENNEKISSLKKTFLNNLNKEHVTIVSNDDSSPYVISLLYNGLRGQVLQNMLQNYDIIVGTGSACSSNHPHSRVLKACGYSSNLLDGALRISFFVNNTEEEVKFASERLNACVEEFYKKTR